MIKPEILTGRLGNKMFQYAYLYAQARDGVISDVYVQNLKFFEKYSEELKVIFGQRIGYLDQVGVHIRRAANPINPDEPKYCDNSFYINLSKTNYYEKAMALFPKDDFLVFSDDPEWCQEKFRDNKRVQVMEKGDEVEDFNLLASCKDLIIANSSFSWWAAYLCPNPSKKIVAPSKWYADGVERTICPKDWIKVIPEFEEEIRVYKLDNT